MRRTAFRCGFVLILAVAVLVTIAGSPALAQSDTPRADAMVLVNSASAGYSQYEQYVQPYLGHFGIPCTILDISTTPVPAEIEDYAVIIIGHRQFDTDGFYLDATDQTYITSAVNGGSGLVNFDNDLSADGSTPRYQFVDDLFGFGYTAPPSAGGITITSESYLGFRIDCWDDAHQDPVLPTTEVVGDLSETDGLWTEFLYLASRDYPTILAAVDEDTLGLPELHFFDSGLPNGDYEVFANLYTSGSGRDMRYFYGYTPGDPREFSVDTVGGTGGSDQHAEYSLGTVSITDGTFDLYVQDAELLGGTYPFFGWAWIRLVGEDASGELHYITERHTDGDTISTGSMTLAGITLPAGPISVASVGSHPFIAVTDSGLGRAVQWGSCDWMSHSVKGPVYNLDDLVWRSIVWAARKPFVMQGLPPFLTMRVDDESGPFGWIEIANEFGIKPWAGLFFHNVDATEAAHLSTLVNAGLATTAIHAKSSQFFYYNHGVGDWPQATVDANFAEGTQWHLDHNIPIAKYILPHYYEFGTNVFQGLSDWGVEFVGVHMDPGSNYGSPWIMNGPFRLYEMGSSSSVTPQYYADFITVPGHPEFDGQFFNCVTEIRDDAGYEWYPSSDVQLSIDRGTRQTKRAMDGMDLATLFTHSQHVTGIPSQSWRDILQGITNNLQAYDPMFVTMDYACQYVRAMHTSDIAASHYDPVTRELTTSFSGETDMSTMFYLFTDQGSTIQHLLVDVPLFSGAADVLYTVPGPLGYIVVTPNPATVVTGASQIFTAQGFDAENNPIPNLDFTWSVVAGGGTIDQGGVFTAGTTGGVFTDTVEAAINAISGHATVEVVAPTLDHFTIEPVDSPQYVGLSFPVTITARDFSGGVLTGYSGSASLTDTTGTILPATTGSFTGGVWTGPVAIDQPGTGITITAMDGASQGTSGSFDVEAMPSFYQVTSTSYLQDAGQPFVVTVTAYQGTTVNCWEDDHQNPVLVTFYDPGLFVPDDDQWDEFHYSARPYPAVFAHQTENPPVMEFYSVVPNGSYRMYANLYRSNDFRYYYGFDAGTPRDFSVDVASGTVGDFTEFDLGTVTVSDNMFALFVDHADVILDVGNFPYYGWAWIRLVPVEAETLINCWEDDHQEPVLATTEVVGDLSETDGAWTEFLYPPVRDYPSILAAVDEDLLGLPMLRFYDSGIPNGEYDVVANLYTSSAGRDMRYFYGYTPGDPREFSVDTVGGAGGTEQHAEYSLGSVSITDGTFNLYVQDAELLGGTYPFFGWAWVRLVSTAVTMSSDSPDMLFDGDEDSVFGEPGDDTGILVNGTFDIAAMDSSGGADISIMATDLFARTGSHLYNIYSAGPTASLILRADKECYAEDDLVTITVDLANAESAIVDGYFFLQYDPLKLEYVSADPGDPPFNTELIEVVDEGSGTIDFSVSAPIGDPGTLLDTTMAYLSFYAASGALCDEPGLLSFREHDPPTSLTVLGGDSVDPELNDLDLIDITAPTITVPPDDNLHCLSDVPAPDFAGGSASDNCDLNPEVTHQGDSDNGGTGCPGDALIITRTYRSTDTCGNFSEDTQTFTILDDTAPLITVMPPDVSVQCSIDVPAPDFAGGSTSDNCDPSPVVIHQGDVSDGLSCPETITRTYRATDSCGNWTEGTQSITVDDTIAPVISGMPSNITVNADAGLCTAVVTWDEPTATDNCNLASFSSDYPSGDTFDGGTTTVTYTAYDGCGNWVESFFDVTVDPFNEMLVDITLSPAVVAGPLTRCITFELHECGVGSQTVEQVLTFTSGNATATVLVPCGLYECITARDRLHTLRRTIAAPSFQISGVQYAADFASDANDLIGGNLNDDDWIDILDFGVFNWQFGVGGSETNCTSTYPHADINGDGLVETDDFTFIQINFLDTHDSNCCGDPTPLGGSQPVMAISVQDLITHGLDQLAAGDLNSDGWLDQADVIAFLEGARPDQIGIGGVNKPLMQNRK